MENPASNPVPSTPSKTLRHGALIWMIISQLLACLIIFGASFISSLDLKWEVVRFPPILGHSCFYYQSCT
jgi:hypothetical protein